MKSSGSAVGGSMGGGAGVLGALTRTSAKDDAAPISRGSQGAGRGSPGGPGKKARFADLLGDELSAANDALPPSDATPTTADAKTDHQDDEAPEPDARALTLAQPLVPPNDAPLPTAFAWPTPPPVEVKAKADVLPGIDAGPSARFDPKVSASDVEPASEPLPTLEASKDEAAAQPLATPALPTTHAQPSSAKAEPTSDAPVATPAAPMMPDATPAPVNANAIPIPAQMTPTATAVSASVTAPTSATKPSVTTSPSVTKPSPRPTASASASAAPARPARTSAATAAPDRAKPSPSAREDRQSATDDLPTAAVLAPFTPSPVFFPPPAPAAGPGAFAEAAGKSEAGAAGVAESSADATANAIRNAEAVGHRRVLAGDAHGALSVGDLGRFEVSAKTQDDGRVDVHVRAEQHAGAALLEHHAAELRADVRIEVPRAFVAVQDSPAAHHGASSGATDSGAQARTSDREASSRNERGSDGRDERGGVVGSAPVAATPKASSNKRLARVKIVL